MVIPTPIFAAVVVLVASTDWALRVDGVPDPICAKSEAVCETARRAIRHGRWPLDLPADVPTACVPSPGCFSPQSEVIRGFNDAGLRR